MTGLFGLGWLGFSSVALGLGLGFAASANAGLPPTLKMLDGSEMATSELGGKVVLVVNVASKCGFTKQYDDLQALHEKYQDQDLVVLGVPCNQFGGQEPGSAEEIQSFCRMNFGVSFPLLEKQDVKGNSRSALYTHLVSSDVAAGKEVKWNFEKFLVDPEGAVIARYRSKTSPEDPELIEAVERGLLALD